MKKERFLNLLLVVLALWIFLEKDTNQCYLDSMQGTLLV